MKRILAIYDADTTYAQRFAEFVNRKNKLPFQAVPFTSMERLEEYCEQNGVEVLLTGAAVSEEKLNRLSASRIITLSEGEYVPAGEHYPCIYKYQSAEEIIREVMSGCCENPLEKPLTVLSKRGAVIGVYSPVNRCLKTSFSLTLGQLLSRDSKVLYLNMEEYSGLGTLMNEEYRGGLSDILYYYQQKNFDWMRLSTVVYSWGSLDYIPPVCFPEDLDLINGPEMAGLLTQIASESPYETVVADVGQFGKKALDVLEVCKVVYMPVKDDCVSAAKLEEFETYVRAAGREELLARVRRLKLPYHSSFGRKDNYVEQLVWGELGDYVRNLLKGQNSTWES